MRKPADKYQKLKKRFAPDLSLPGDFFDQDASGLTSCIFMLSCLGTDKLLYLDPSFQALSGYSSKTLMERGMDFWFSLVHPDDREPMSEKIIESHKLLEQHGYNEKQPIPLVLTYRIRHGKGKWVWIKDTKFLVSFSEKAIDKVLGKFEVLESGRISEEELKKKLDAEKSCTKLLDFALIHQHEKQKEPVTAANINPDNPATGSPLTRREKEILQMIAEGFSTKIIAAKCNISVNTVETHRRHLLEKLQVKNSMELIKEASKIYWL